MSAPAERKLKKKLIPHFKGETEQKLLSENSVIFRAIYLLSVEEYAGPITYEQFVCQGVPPELAQRYVTMRQETALMLKKMARESNKKNKRDIRSDASIALERYTCTIYRSEKMKQKSLLDLLSYFGNLKSSDVNVFEKEIEYRTAFEATKVIKKTKPKPVSKVTISHDAVLHLPDKMSDFPASTVVLATIVLKKKYIGKIAIVSDEKDQDTEKGFFWVGRTLPSLVLSAIKFSAQREFIYRTHTYRISRHTEFQTAPRYFEIISRFCNPDRPQIVHVFAQKNIDHYQSSDYETVTAMVPCADTSMPVPMSVYYEISTKRYFVNEVLYSTYRQKYGLPYMRLRPAPSITGDASFAALRPHSELNLLGYSVGVSGGLTITRRHELLRQIVDSGVLSKAEIMSHLEWLINTRRGMDGQENAVGEWRTDLIYMANYEADKQRTIWVKTFASKYQSK